MLAFCTAFGFSQITVQESENDTTESKQINIVYGANLTKNEELYPGAFIFSKDTKQVQFEHQGADLWCDVAIFYQKDNKLIIRIQPDEGILIKFGVKVPGQGFKVERANLDFYYSSLTETHVMQAYERLLLDAMQGDPTLYARADEVEAAWEFVDPILDYWKDNKDVRVYGYSAGVWGPENADELLEGIGSWRNPGPNLADDPGFCVIC